MGDLKILLDKKMRHKVTGFEGICTAISFNNVGIVQFMLEAIDTTGRPVEWWINGSQVEVID